MIASAINRFPKLFDERLQKSWYQLLANSDSQFFKARSTKHLRKTLLLQFLLKKKIESALEKEPNQKHVFVKGFLISSNSFAIAISISQLHSQEQIDYPLIFSHLGKIYPGLKEIANSFLTWKHPRLPYAFYYIEIQKLRGKSLCQSEIKQIQSLLQEKISHSPPSLIQPVFWPYNEEEAYRQLLFLKQEINSPSDYPQLSIHFHMQDSSSLEFLVYLARPQTSSPQIPSYFTSSSLKMYSRLHATFPGVPKTEGYVLSFIIPADSFYEESMVHLLHARRRITRHIEELLGPFRDCNGGLFEKQQASFETLKSKLPDKLDAYLFLAEKLFYAIQPVESRFSISSSVFNSLLDTLVTAHSSRQQTVINHSHISVVKSKDVKIASLYPLKKSETLPLHALFSHSGWCYLVMLSSDPPTPKPVQPYSYKKRILQIAFQEGPLPSLHPHDLFSDMRSLVLCKALFEGCTRLNENGKTVLAGAETIKNSSNQTSYDISLRNNHWSNGEKVTAFQYEKSWKKALLKNRSSHVSLNPFSFLKNAQQIWKSRCPIDDLGVFALDEKTLRVELEFPCPNFTKFLSHPIFSPFYLDSHFPKHFNGPFLIRKYLENSLVLEKNIHYWNASSIKLQEIKIDFQADPDEIFSSFREG
ncbi:MAG: ABC transporter substrate-binding protein, partial [Chlamydiales bacterium]